MHLRLIVPSDRSERVLNTLVAVLAGCAGVLSQTAGRGKALVGVFISVTTFPPRATSPCEAKDGRAR